MADILQIAGEIIRSYGGYVGSASAGAVGYAFKRFRDVEKGVQTAIGGIKELRQKVSEIEKKCNDLKDDVDAKLSGHTSASMAVAQQTEDQGDDLQKLKEDIARERGARHALNKQFSDYVKGDEEQWRALHRSLGQIEGRLEIMLAKKIT